MQFIFFWFKWNLKKLMFPGVIWSLIYELDCAKKNNTKIIVNKCCRKRWNTWAGFLYWMISFIYPLVYAKVDFVNHFVYSTKNVSKCIRCRNRVEYKLNLLLLLSFVDVILFLSLSSSSSSSLLSYLSI